MAKSRKRICRVKPCVGNSIERNKQNNRPKDGECVIFIGGRYSHRLNWLYSVYDSWMKGFSLFSGFSNNQPYIAANMPPLPRYIKNGNAVVYRDTVYVSGGDGSKEVLQFRNCISNKNSKCWEMIGKMNHRRRGHLMEVMDDTIVVCGGGSDNCERSDNGITWKVFLPQNKYNRGGCIYMTHGASTSYRGHIVLMGGQCSDRYRTGPRLWDGRGFTNGVKVITSKSGSSHNTYFDIGRYDQRTTHHIGLFNINNESLIYVDGRNRFIIFSLETIITTQ